MSHNHEEKFVEKTLASELLNIKDSVDIISQILDESTESSILRVVSWLKGQL